MAHPPLPLAAGGGGTHAGAEVPSPPGPLPFTALEPPTLMVRRYAVDRARDTVPGRGGRAVGS